MKPSAGPGSWRRSEARARRQARVPLGPAKRAKEMSANIRANTDGGLVTAGNCAVVFIDDERQMTFGVATSMDKS